MSYEKKASLQTGWRLHPREHRTILLVGDLFVAGLALLGGLYFWAQQDAWLKFSLGFIQTRVPFWFYLLPLAWLFLLVELYELHRASNIRRTITGISVAALTGLLFYSLIYLISPKGSLPRWGIGFFLLFASGLTLIWRIIYIRIFTAPAFMRRMLIIGAGKAGSTIAHAYKNLFPSPFYLVGFIDDDPKKHGKKIEGYPILAGSESLLELAEKENVSDLVMAITGEMHGRTFQIILDAQERGIEVTPMPTLYEELLGRVPVYHLESDWLIRSFVDEVRASGLYETTKRLLDIIGAIIGLAIFTLIAPFAAISTALDSGFPILYSQTRSGKGGKEYVIYKIRTMRQDAESDGMARLAQEGDERITRVGNFLRRTHIDELPQFINVLRGQMSLVGPRAERPELVQHFQKQIPFYRARLLVKPGVTGWAQINYGYVATVAETTVKLEYDLYYIKHRNLVMDIAIILRTVGQVISLRGR